MSSLVSVALKSFDVYWAAAVGVEDRVRADQASPVGQLDGVADEFGAHVGGHGVPDDLPVEQVDRGGQVQPALGGG